MMKKLVLVPYDKYQGILAKTRSSKIDGNSRSSSTRMTELAGEISPPPSVKHRKKIKPKTGRF